MREVVIVASKLCSNVLFTMALGAQCLISEGGVELRMVLGTKNAFRLEMEGNT